MRRTHCQNVIFRGASHDSDPYEPPGHDIATKLRNHLREDGLAAAEEDNWRDCGWSIDVTIRQVVIQVAIARTSKTDHWIAQVASLNEPGLVARFLGRRFVSRDSEVLDVSRSIHRCLLEAGYCDVVWCLDAFPDTATGVSEPVVSGDAAAS